MTLVQIYAAYGGPIILVLLGMGARYWNAQRIWRAHQHETKTHSVH